MKAGYDGPLLDNKSLKVYAEFLSGMDKEVNRIKAAGKAEEAIQEAQKQIPSTWKSFANHAKPNGTPP